MDTDEVSNEYVEAAGPMMKAEEVLDEEMGATTDTTENGEEKVKAAGSLSKVEEIIGKEIVAADPRDAIPHHIPYQSDSVTPHHLGSITMSSCHKLLVKHLLSRLTHSTNFFNFFFTILGRILTI